MKIKTKIVGMRHKNIDLNSFPLIARSDITLKKDSANPYDMFAVQCWCNYLHVGYVEASKSEKISRLIDRSEQISIKVLDYDEYNIYIEISSFTKDDKRYERALTESICGIYKIEFRYEGDKYVYIGQSVNINQRIKTHYRTLIKYEHHNRLMQSAWLADESSFSDAIVETIPKHLGVLERQIWLFQREYYHIRQAGVKAANLIDADLVLTEEAISQLNMLINAIKQNLKRRRSDLEDRKIEVGRLFIAHGIIKEERFSDGFQRGSEPRKYLTVSPSNILTWIHKKRRSPLEYIPTVDYRHPKFQDLKDALEKYQESIKTIDQHKRYIQSFIETLEGKKRYETCNIEDLHKVLKIISLYMK